MIRVIINPKDRAHIMRAVKGVIRQSDVQTRNMPRRCSLEAVQLLRGNINKQAYLPYASYTQKYRRWKMKQGLTLMFWKLSGELIQNIKYHHIRTREYVAGILPSAMDSGGKSYGQGRRVPIAMYAHVLEYGGSYGAGGTHPARPVFRPTAKEYRAGLMLKQADKSLTMVGNKWI